MMAQNQYGYCTAGTRVKKCEGYKNVPDGVLYESHAPNFIDNLILCFTIIVFLKYNFKIQLLDVDVCICEPEMKKNIDVIFSNFCYSELVTMIKI